MAAQKPATCISFQPTKSQLDEIEKWLLEEERSLNEGFYCNWSIIRNLYQKKQMATVSFEKLTVGFVVWLYTSKFTAHIEMVEININYRNKGFGRKLITALLDKFKKDTIYAVDLQCAPAESESAWKHMGFSNFPDGSERWNTGNRKMYKILVPSAATGKHNGSSEVIQLWNAEPILASDREPEWEWNVQFEKNTHVLVTPIIHPCLHDWRIRWKRHDKTLKDKKVKYFSHSTLVFDNFLIIKELN